MFKRPLIALAVAAVVAAPAFAAKPKVDPIKAAVEDTLAGVTVTSVNMTPVANVREVVVNGSQVVYVTKDGKYAFFGDLVDLTKKESLTQKTMDKLTAIKFEDLPFEQAIKEVRGDGSRKVAVFSDPDCPYCKKLEVETSKLDNVTIYTFLYPLPFHQEARPKAISMWCAEDPAKAWKDYMLENKVPESKECENPVDKNLELGQRLRVDGTPTMFFQSGKRLPGALPLPRIEAELNAK